MGHLPFRARPHHGLAARDPLGPHAVGEWGEDQTSVHVPVFWITSPRWPEVLMPGNYWLHAVRRPDGAGPCRYDQTRSHRPKPLAELVADVLLGKVDAVEIRDFTWGIESFAVREWYRLLNTGFRLPAVGGTHKMSAGIPIGGVRTYAQVGTERTFDAWQAAVRSSRTLTTSGAVVELVVEGVAPEGQVPVGDGQATLDVEATARSILPVSRLEVVHNGAVVAATDGPARHLRLAERLRLGPGWVSRTLGPARLWHVWPIALAAHTSPIYLTGRAAPVEAGDVQYLGLLLEGGLAWLDTLATGPRGPASEHMRGVFSDAQRRLGELQRPSRVDARTPRAGARGARPS